MLSLLPLLPLLAGAPQIEPATVQDDWMVLGEVQVFGQTDPDGRTEPARTVQLKFPKNVAEPANFDGPAFDYKGGKVLLNEWGNLGRVHWAGDGWAEVRALREKAQQAIAAGSAVPWKVKAILMTRSDFLQKDPNGVLVIQDNVMLDEEVTLLLESFVRMEALVEAYSGGAVDVQVDYSIERDPIVNEYETPQVSWSPELAEFYFYRARYNRGDYDSVISAYTGAEADIRNPSVTRGKSNGAVQSTVLFSNGREGHGNLWHTEQLLRQFLEGVRVSAFDWGYGAEYATLLPLADSGVSAGYVNSENGYPGAFAWLKDYARSIVPPTMWQKVRNRTLPDYTNSYSLMKSYDGQLKRWGDVASDPWAGLPLITAQDVATRIGATSIAVQEREANVLFLPEGGHYRTPMKSSMDVRDAMFNNQLNSEREGIA